MKRSDLVLSLTQRLLLLFFVFLVCYMLTMACVYALNLVLSDRPAAILRISAVLQDVFTFVAPAIITALIVTRRPAKLLCIPSVPTVTMIFIVVGILFVSIPAQEAVIYWNYNIELPASMSSFEESARKMESASFKAMCTLLGNTSVWALLVNILIIGLAAGFSEELLFRGCFQRLLTTGGVNKHVAVWTVAIVFSSLHFQFFGFVPRVLLGAYFGYLLVWTKSLWVPALAHMLNNIMFVLTSWKHLHDGKPLTDEPTLWSVEVTVVSLFLTGGMLWMMWRYGKKITAAA